MHVILLNWVQGRGGEPSRIHELHLDARAQDASPPNLVDLVVVDAREMDPAALNACIVWVARLRNSQPVRKAMMICRKPPIEFVVRAIRAGINDISERPLTGRQILRLLISGQNDKAARAAARSLMKTGHLLALTDMSDPTSGTATLYERERRVEDLQKQLASESSRLEQVRETLHVRETELLSRARRFDEEFARLQGDGDLAKVKIADARPDLDDSIPSGNSEEHERLRRAEAQLKARAAEIDRRETALVTRDRMLREFEAMLLSQAQAPAR